MPQAKAWCFFPQEHHQAAVLFSGFITVLTQTSAKTQQTLGMHVHAWIHATVLKPVAVSMFCSYTNSRQELHFVLIHGECQFP